MPTRLPTAERRVAARTWAGWGAVAGCLALSAAPARAHEPAEQALPEAAGWQLGGALDLLLPRADARWPAPAWPGVLVNGSAARDQRGGLRLNHATLGLGARHSTQLGARLELGWHDRERMHVEAASVQWQQPWRDGELLARLGRDTASLGPVIDGAGHFDALVQPPLAKRAVLNDQWIDDGASLSWRRGDAGADGLRGITAGLWRGRVFPGGPDGPVVPSLHLQAGWGALDAHLSAAHWEPSARGAAVATAGATGHVHGTLDCRAGLQQRVCFDGRADLLAASLQWAPEHARWALAVAGLLRDEQGTLYSTSGDAAIRTRVHGVWADARWQPAARWTLTTRLERLVPSQRLSGVGTALLAREAGLADGGPVERLSTALWFAPQPQLQLALETGQERFNGGRVTHVALRALWRHPRWLSASW